MSSTPTYVFSLFSRPTPPLIKFSTRSKAKASKNTIALVDREVSSCISKMKRSGRLILPRVPPQANLIKRHSLTVQQSEIITDRLLKEYSSAIAHHIKLWTRAYAEHFNRNAPFEEIKSTVLKIKIRLYRCCVEIFNNQVIHIIGHNLRKEADFKKMSFAVKLLSVERDIALSLNTVGPITSFESSYLDSINYYLSHQNVTYLERIERAENVFQDGRPRIRGELRNFRRLVSDTKKSEGVLLHATQVIKNIRFKSDYPFLPLVSDRST
ncbi:MAG: hypothetical protein GWP59_01045 [Chlamydiales bacterium]|nr:hypothetical protein [Chlamydiales bacterium]NCF70264.1 hypothetical protein [Chlamydiales bacterium]